MKGSKEDFGRNYPVKKIVVYTQDIVQNNDSLAAIENKKAVVNTLSNGIIAKKRIRRWRNLQREKH